MESPREDTLNKKSIFLKVLSFFRHVMSLHENKCKCQNKAYNVCFKKTVIIHSSDTVLWIVTVFFETDVRFYVK